MQKQITRTILLATAATLALYFIPYAGFITYPIRLLVTFIHEGGHAFAALLSGGHVHGLGVSPDGSGLTLTSGGFAPFINASGYLGATLYGALLLSLLRRGVAPRLLLGITALAVLLMLPAAVMGLNPLQPTQGAFFALLAGIPILLALGGAALKLSPDAQSGLVGFLGVQFVLNALFDLRTLFLLSAATNTPTDALNMQHATLIPAVVWAALWLVSALGILWAVLLRPALKGNGSSR